MSTGARRDTGRRPCARRTAALITRPMRVPRLRERGESFGPYTVLELLGEGSTCAVFAAEHPALQEPLAIKVLHRKLLGDPAVAQRMIDEARTIATLDHPGIVEVFDIGRSTAGRPFVVLERLVGEPLSKRLRHGRLPEDRIVTFTRQLASALDAAHRDGIVHRDLKPENIYIVADPTSPCGERIKVLDFGIAKRRASPLHTLTGIVLGTPAYMAPEQARGMRQLDGRTDIYALGIVMYVMATGTLPFSGASTDEILAEHAYCEPVPAAALATITPALSAIIGRCLAKRPEDRYPGMSELAAALGELASRRPGPPATAAIPAAQPRWSWRRMLALAAPTAIAIGAAVGIAAPRASMEPASAARPGLALAPAVRLEPPALTRRQVRKPELPAASDRARPGPRKPAPPPVKRAASGKPAAPAKPRSAAPAVHWDPDALWYPQHEPPFAR